MIFSLVIHSIRIIYEAIMTSVCPFGQIASHSAEFVYVFCVLEFVHLIDDKSNVFSTFEVVP